MAQLRSVNTHFWTDSYVSELTPVEKLLFLYLLTNPAMSLAGCFERPLRQISFDTGIKISQVGVILERFARDNKVVFRDGWFVLLNFLKHQNLNKNMGIAAAKELNAAPKWVRQLLSESLETIPEWFPNHSEPLPNDNESSKEMKGSEGKGNRNENELEAEISRPAERIPNHRPKPLATKPESEIDTWLNATAPITGAKGLRTMANAKRWRDTIEKAVAEQRNLPDFLAVVKSERERNKASPQFFTPEGCLKALQTSAPPGNSNGKAGKPQWQTDIEKCERCDDNGRIMQKDPVAGYKAIVCKHGKT